MIAAVLDDDAGPDPEEARDAADLADARAARVDLAAFAPLYDRYHDAIYGYCLRRLGSREGAGDATSQTFTRAMTAIGRFHGGSFRAWLFAIARNVVIDAVRRQRPVLPLDGAGEVPDRDPSPEQQAIASDQRRELAAALGQLTAEQRDVVELRMAGLTGPEVAAALGLSLGAVKSLQFRAYGRLRTLLHDLDRTGDLR